MARKNCKHIGQVIAVFGLVLISCFVGQARSTGPTCPGLLAVQQSPLSARAAEMENKLFAVHVTSIFPKDGQLIAGAQDISKGPNHVKTEPPSFRPTIHFSLGEMVRSHGGHSRENFSFAVVTPLKSLKPQLLNLSPYDTFILGNFKIPPEATLIVPVGFTGPFPEGVQVVHYDRGTSLREAIDKVIAEKAGWKVKMLETSNQGAPATIDGQNINSKEFFEPLLRQHPFWSFGSHLYSEVGEISRMGMIEQLLDSMMKSFTPSAITANYDELMLADLLIRHNLTFLDRYLKAAALSVPAMSVYRNKREQVIGWLNILAMEKMVHGRGYTMTRPKEEILDELSKIKNSRAELESFVSTMLDHQFFSTVVEGRAGRIGMASWARILALMNPVELNTILSQQVGAITPENRDLVLALYSVARITLMDRGHLRSENLYGLLDNQLAKLRGKGFGKQMLKSVFSLLGDQLDLDSPRLPLALSLFARPSVRQYFNEDVGMELPANPTFEDLLRQHPDTKAIFEVATGTILSNEEQLALKIALRLEPELEPEDVLPRTFSEADSKVFVKVQSQKMRHGVMVCLNSPLTSTVPLNRMLGGQLLSFYQQMARGDFGSLDHIAEQLGIAAKFRQRFPSDADFWASPDSLVQIYVNLSK